jgi:hypothetical protein
MQAMTSICGEEEHPRKQNNLAVVLTRYALVNAMKQPNTYINTHALILSSKRERDKPRVGCMQKNGIETHNMRTELPEPMTV